MFNSILENVYRTKLNKSFQAIITQSDFNKRRNLVLDAVASFIKLYGVINSDEKKFTVSIESVRQAYERYVNSHNRGLNGIVLGYGSYSIFWLGDYCDTAELIQKKLGRKYTIHCGRDWEPGMRSSDATVDSINVSLR